MPILTAGGVACRGAVWMSTQWIRAPSILFTGQGVFELATVDPGMPLRTNSFTATAPDSDNSLHHGVVSCLPVVWDSILGGKINYLWWDCWHEGIPSPIELGRPSHYFTAGL